MTPAFASAASRAANAPRRLAFMYVPNGVTMADWTPKRRRAAAFEFTRILKPLEAFRERHAGPDGPVASQRRGARRRPRRPCARGRLVPHGRPSAKDRRRRHPERHLGRSDRGAAPGRAGALSVPRARMRRLADGGQLRFRLLVRLHQQPRLARPRDADASGDEPAPGLRAAVRRRRHQSRPRRARGAWCTAAASSTSSPSGRRS